MKILVEIHHGLGDVVQMMPVFQKLREVYPEAHILALVASMEHAKILKIANLVEKYYILNLQKMSAAEIFKLVINLHKEKIDLGIIVPMTNEKKGKILMRLLGCRKTLYPNRNENFENSNSVMQGLSILEPLGIKARMIQPYIPITDEIARTVDKVLPKYKNKKVFSICVGTGLVCKKNGRKREYINAKCISPKESIKVANYLVQKGENVILLGGIQEKIKFEEYMEYLDKRVVSLLGETTILESMAVLSISKIVLGGDTGLMHIAGAMNIETITYYGASGPKVGPFSEKNHEITANLECQYCYGTNRIFECQERKCLEYITSEVLINQINNILKLTEERNILI